MVSLVEIVQPVRCPKDGQRLMDVSLRGRGRVYHRCRKCGQLWRYDLYRRELTLEPAGETATETCAALAVGA